MYLKKLSMFRQHNADDRMKVEQLLESKLAGKTEVPRENLPQCYFGQHKSHMTSVSLQFYITDFIDKTFEVPLT
jgi:hypothetical protein